MFMNKITTLLDYTAMMHYICSMTKIRVITFRVPEEEFRILTAYAEQVARSKSDVLREFIRSLRPKKRS